MDRKLLVISVSRKIAEKRKKPLSTYELIYLKKSIMTIDKAIIAGKSPEEIIPVFADIYEKELLKLPKNIKKNDVDIKEILVSEVGQASETIIGSKKISKDATFDSLLQNPRLLQSIINPDALKKKTYLILDRKYMARDCNNITEFKWNITDQSNKQETGYAVSSIAIRDIVSMRMYSFSIPNIKNNVMYSTKQVSIEMIELNHQSYIQPACNKKFHFIYHYMGY